jgi:hypothetical protein
MNDSGLLYTTAGNAREKRAANCGEALPESARQRQLAPRGHGPPRKVALDSFQPSLRLLRTIAHIRWINTLMYIVGCLKRIANVLIFLIILARLLRRAAAARVTTDSDSKLLPRPPRAPCG